MTWSLVSLILQLVMKILPILYTFKILRNEADLKELQRRVGDAIRAADDRALDSAKTKQTSTTAREEAEKKWKEKWGTKPIPPVDPKPNDPDVPGQPKVPQIIAPDKVKMQDMFRVTLLNMPENGVVLFIDRFQLQEIGVVRKDIPITLYSDGDRTLYAKVNGVTLAEKKILVEPDRPG